MDAAKSWASLVSMLALLSLRAFNNAALKFVAIMFTARNSVTGTFVSDDIQMSEIAVPVTLPDTPVILTSNDCVDVPMLPARELSVSVPAFSVASASVVSVFCTSKFAMPPIVRSLSTRNRSKSCKYAFVATVPDTPPVTSISMLLPATPRLPVTSNTKDAALISTNGSASSGERSVIDPPALREKVPSTSISPICKLLGVVKVKLPPVSAFSTIKEPPLCAT